MYRLLALLALLLWQSLAAAEFTITTTADIRNTIPIAVIPFSWDSASTATVTADHPAAADLPKTISTIVAADLTRSGRFQALAEDALLQQPQSGADIDFRIWRTLGQKAIALGKVHRNGPDDYSVLFQLFDAQQGKQLISKQLPTKQQDLRTVAHWIADAIYEQLTGIPGAFSSKIAYISAEQDGDSQASLNVSDIDGHNSQTIVSSSEPLLSPAWSPDGNKLAYVSLEQQQCAIYIQELQIGRRQQIAAYAGINSAPAWSPDGQHLALVLSRDGDPEIYVLNLATKALLRVTYNVAIDTEPAWSPNGRTLVFTSDRGGSPQIYVVPASGGEAKRLTFKGDYNAHPVYSPDGNSLAIVTRRDGAFRIALFNLSTKALQELSPGPLDESPSFFANGSMIIYATQIGGHSELAAVSINGQVRQRITTDAGVMREPAYSANAQ